MTTPTPLPATAVDRTPRLALLFTDETVWTTRFGPDGAPLVTYPVQAADVAAAFNAASAESGLLPPGTLFWQRRKGETRLGVWLAPQVRVLAFEAGRGAHRIRIPLPGFVWVGAGSRYFLYAAKTRPTQAGDPLFLAPLPNIHDDGRACFGNVALPKANPQTILRAAQLFFESNFNTHLAEGKVKQPHGRETSLYRFLKGLEGRRTFPARALLPYDRFQSVLQGRP